MVPVARPWHRQGPPARSDVQWPRMAPSVTAAASEGCSTQRGRRVARGEMSRNEPHFSQRTPDRPVRTSETTCSFRTIALERAQTVLMAGHLMLIVVHLPPSRRGSTASTERMPPSSRPPPSPLNCPAMGAVRSAGRGLVSQAYEEGNVGIPRSWQYRCPGL